MCSTHPSLCPAHDCTLTVPCLTLGACRTHNPDCSVTQTAYDLLHNTTHPKYAGGVDAMDAAHMAALQANANGHLSTSASPVFNGSPNGSGDGGGGGGGGGASFGSSGGPGQPSTGTYSAGGMTGTLRPWTMPWQTGDRVTGGKMARAIHKGRTPTGAFANLDLAKANK